MEVFKQHLLKRIKGLISEIREKWGDHRDITSCCQDETRLGFRTESGQKITLKGVNHSKAYNGIIIPIIFMD